MESNASWSIVTLAIDNYIGNKNKRIIKDGPSLKDIESAVKSLDGAGVSSFCIIASDNSVLVVGGGPDGYHVQITNSDGVYLLYDPNKTDQKIDIIIGSVLTHLASKYIVDKKSVIVALEKYYFRNTC